MSKYTNEEIASKWQLWMTYVDPEATMTKEEFDAMSVEDKVEMIEDIWPDDDDDEE